MSPDVNEAPPPPPLLSPHAYLQTAPGASSPKTTNTASTQPALAGAKDPQLASLTPAQLAELNDQLLAEAQPHIGRALISAVLPMSEIRDEYKGAPVFQRRIDWLARVGYKQLRRSRGDGDCFYRSMAFAYVEQILHAPDVALAVASSLSSLEASKVMLKDAGFQELVYEDMYDVLVSIVQQVVTPDHTGVRLTPDILLEAFQAPEVSNSVVVYLRLLTSAQIRADADNYAAFLFHPDTGEMMGVREFCEMFVEAIGREADHVQVTALARALQVNVKVAYLDGRGSGDAVEFVEFDNRLGDDNGTREVALLYRPGHYDILLRESA